MIFRRTSLKILLSIIAIIVMSIIVIGVVFYTVGSRIVIAQTKNEAKKMAQIAAAEIDGDLFAAIESQESPGFIDVYDRLSRYKDNKSIQFIYSMKKLEEEQIVFVVDTDEVDPADLFEPYEWLPSMAPAFVGHVCADEEFTSDEWGTYLSGYAPIFDSQHTVTGIVGCDIGVKTINERTVILRNVVTALMIITNVTIFMVFGLKDPSTSSNGGKNDG